MKKLYTFLAAMALVFTVAAQTPKMLMIEEGTQASCPPCATQNPAFDALLEANDANVVVLKYQTSWPGFDQMNLDNPGEVADRISYYGISGVPTAVGNGALWANDCGAWDGAPACLDQAEVDTYTAEMSPIAMTVSGEVQDGMLTVTGTIDASMAAAGDLKLRIALTEQHITSTSAPGGTNGETDYYNVMKKFIGGTSGIDLADMAAGETFSFTETLDLSTVIIYDWTVLGIVAFVQNDADNSVMQAAKDNDVPIGSSYVNNSGVVTAAGLPAFGCSADVSAEPTVTIVNWGSDDLTSVDITYDVNGGTASMYNWTGGPVPTGGDVTVTLPSISFTSMGANTMNVSLANPNGMTDEFPGNDAASVDFTTAVVTDQAEEVLTLTFNTDCWPTENGWTLRSISTGALIAEAVAGTYTNAESEYVETINAPIGDCYEFTFTDTYGDGVNGSVWVNSCTTDGNILLADASGNVVYSNDGTVQFEAETESFTAIAVGLEENFFVNAFDVFPNPVADELTVNFNLKNGAYTTIDIVNPVGQVVSSTVLGNIPTGEYNERLDVRSFANGVYLVRITSANEVVTSRITVAK